MGKKLFLSAQFIVERVTKFRLSSVLFSSMRTKKPSIQMLFLQQKPYGTLLTVMH